jgi:AcrR family transcriptional regulator
MSYRIVFKYKLGNNYTKEFEDYFDTEEELVESILEQPYKDFIIKIDSTERNRPGYQHRGRLYKTWVVFIDLEKALQAYPTDPRLLRIFDKILGRALDLE